MSKLHPRNAHQGRYNLDLLSHHFSALSAFLINKRDGEQTIDFSDPQAVLTLNQSLLAYFYKVHLWQIPEGYLCPPIPGRADYIHYLADLLAISNNGNIPKGKHVRVLDVGTGANCIYPIIGSQSYGWQFVGTDIDLVSVNCAKNIVKSNACLRKNIKVFHQENATKFFEGVIGRDDMFDLTMCNPPFFSSMAEAEAANQRKQKNLHSNKMKRSNSSNKKTKLVYERNFGGQNSELWCDGGEITFLKNMAKESLIFSKQVKWFSSLVSKSNNVDILVRELNVLGAKKIEIIKMSQGNKISRFVAWRFFV